MTGHYNTAAHASTPTLCRETSAFLMKATYQRHMLYGWAVALSVITAIALLISVWPVESAPPIAPEPVKVDTVAIPEDIWKPVVIERELVGPCPPPPSNRGGGGPLIDKIMIVADSFEIDSDGQLGPGGDDDGLYVEEAPFGYPGGGGGTVFIPDTSARWFNSAELDRPPVLVAMDQPEYPPLAKRIATEGKVLLHILVDTKGRVAEVRIEEESNPNFGFGEQAARAARSAVFSPAIANRQPVRCWVALPVVFEME